MSLKVHLCKSPGINSVTQKLPRAMARVYIKRQNLTDFLCLQANFVYLVCNDICGRLVKYPQALGPFHTQLRIDFYRICHNGIIEKEKEKWKKEEKKKISMLWPFLYLLVYNGIYCKLISNLENH